MRDWTTAVRRAPAFRVNKPWLAFSDWNSKNVFRVFSVITMLLFVSFIILLFTLPPDKDCPCVSDPASAADPFNSTYPLTPPVYFSSNRTTKFRIAVITDLDTASKSESDKDTWFSYIKYGHLAISDDHRKVFITWDNDHIQIKSNLAQKGRSMELSELKVFNGHLLTVDDRTGIVYRFENGEVIPWVILTDGNGNDSKGFKGEWMTIKNRKLYVGGLGKEWTSIHGELQNFNPMWVKKITPMGGVKHVDWKQVYIDLRAAAGIYYPGW